MNTKKIKYFEILPRNILNKKMANLIRTVVLLGLVITLCLGADSIPAMEHKKVVEANHFYSDT